jgi:hypothetical protein
MGLEEQVWFSLGDIGFDNSSLKDFIPHIISATSAFIIGYGLYKALNEWVETIKPLLDWHDYVGL